MSRVTISARSALVRNVTQVRSHAGLILVSTKTFPQDRGFVGAVARALAAVLDKPGQMQLGLELPAANFGRTSWD